MLIWRLKFNPDNVRCAGFRIDVGERKNFEVNKERELFIAHICMRHQKIAKVIESSSTGEEKKVNKKTSEN